MSGGFSHAFIFGGNTRHSLVNDYGTIKTLFFHHSSLPEEVPVIYP